MKKFRRSRFIIAAGVVIIAAANGFFAQNGGPGTRSQDVSETDGVPVLTKHLPDYENAAKRATYILNRTDLQNALGDRPVLAAIDFTGGTEAVTAEYEAGILLIVEYSTPQFSAEADHNIRRMLGESDQSSSVLYRRIGNYNAFVFDATDAGSANVLLDQIKFEKDVRWLGPDPFALKRAERSFVLQTTDLFITTALIVAGGIGLSALAGVVAGLIVFLMRSQKRALHGAFSDAGGMTRLNLDGFTPEVLPDRMLED